MPPFGPGAQCPPRHEAKGSRSLDPRPPRGDGRGRRDDRATIVAIVTSRRPGTAYGYRVALRGEGPVDIVTAVLIDAKLELVNERRIAQSEVTT
jgi:hypothetical protein